jgi:type IV pilus assembly protein PilA
MGLIIAILIAMAIPTFLGARTRAQDRAAQSNLRNALTAEKSYYANGQAYTAVTASLKAIEQSLTYNADAAPTSRSVSRNHIAAVASSTAG